MQERSDVRQEELRFLAREYAKDKNLFVQRTFIEDTHTLGEFGIWIPGKEQCTNGLLKLWPEDFIVEECGQNAVAQVTGEETPVEGEGPTIYATLVKCGLSTIEAVEDIAKKLGLKIEDISYAGIKDKDAITGQKISLRRTSIEAVHSLRSPHFFLKDIHSGKGIVEKGNLKGNRFTILIRTEPALFGEEQSALFAQRLKALQEFGFYNFFYLQRFGTPRLHNFAWAQMILRGEYEKAVRDILSFKGERETPYFKNIRAQMNAQFGDWDGLLRLIEPLPLMFKHEHKIIGHLARNPGDFVGALQAIPEQITLWMYALSSILFNQYISNCLIGGEEPPARLPFFLSRERADWEPYKDMLQALGIYPPRFENLRPFPQVQFKSRSVETKDRADILKSEIVEEGVVLQFELGKGQYATTFLSHLFNLIAGVTPDDFSRSRVDTKIILGEPPLAPLVERFAEVINEKGENLFEKFLSEA